jgi:hypothetical protein
MLQQVLALVGIIAFSRVRMREEVQGKKFCMCINDLLSYGVILSGHFAFRIQLLALLALICCTAITDSAMIVPVHQQQ